MWLIGLIVLIALGLLGIASSLRASQPQLAGPLKQLESIEGWVGVVGLVWGLIGLLQWLLAIGLLAVAPLTMLIGLASLLVIIALSLILAMPLLKTLMGANAATSAMSDTAKRLAPFKVILGAICLAFALYTIVRMVV
jgi:hypothetical protein